jgi:ribonuclease-3 family protein
MGFLYLSGRIERMEELIKKSIEYIEEEKGSNP